MAELFADGEKGHHALALEPNEVVSCLRALSFLDGWGMLSADAERLLRDLEGKASDLGIVLDMGVWKLDPGGAEEDEAIDIIISRGGQGMSPVVSLYATGDIHVEAAKRMAKERGFENVDTLSFTRGAHKGFECRRNAMEEAADIYHLMRRGGYTVHINMVD